VNGAPQAQTLLQSRKETTMRALWRLFLVPLAVAAAVLTGGAPAHLAAAPVHHSAPLADCPAGTNWDHITMTCQ
jgi:hypothetical protein